MSGLAGLGVVGAWTIDIDETSGISLGLTIRSRGFCVQVLVDDLNAVRRMGEAVARIEDDVIHLAIGDMFGATLTLTIADESIVFTVRALRAAATDREHSALVSASFDAQAERSDLAAAIKMALDEAESA